MFGPLGFIAYTDDLTAVSEKNNVHSHMYADDTQLYDSSSPADDESVRDRLTSCVSEVAKWCASRVDHGSLFSAPDPTRPAFITC